MKKLLLAATLIPSAVAFGADESRSQPGLLERVWGSTRNGAGRLWESTKNVGEKTVDAAKSPFRKKEPKPKDSAARGDWHSLAMTMKLDPAVVRLPETRVLGVTIEAVNKGKKAVQLDFPNSQHIEALVKDEAGKVLLRWSDDQRVDREPGSILVNPDERLEYELKISTRDMTAGRAYQIEAFFPGYERLRASRAVTPVR